MKDWHSEVYGAGFTSKDPDLVYQLLTSREWMTQMYWGLNLSTHDIGSVLGLSERIVHRYMVDLGIPRRSPNPPERPAE